MSRSEPRATWRRIMLAAVVAAALPYLPTLTAPMSVYDDGFYLTGQSYWREATLETLWEAVSRPVLANYQPLHLASYWLDLWLWGPSTFALRVSQLALYCCCVAAFVSLARRLAVAPAGAAAAALVFAWHPVHVENVAWLSQRKDLLFLLFMLLALNTWLGPAPCPLTARVAPAPSTSRRLAAVGLFVLALLSKTAAVVFVPVLALVMVLRGRLRRDGPWLALTLVLGLIAARLGYAAQDAYGTTIAPTPWGERLVTVARALAWYLEEAVLARHLSPFPPGPTEVVQAGEWVRLAALLAVALGVVVSWARGRRLFAALAVWFFVVLAPTSGIVPFITYVQDRYLLASTVPLALLVGDVVTRWGRRGREARWVACAASGAAALALLLVAAPYARAWCDVHALFAWTIRQDPGNERALETHAAVLLSSAATSGEGEAIVRRLYEVAPERANTALLMAQILDRRGDGRGARAVLERAAPRDYRAALLLVQGALREGDLEAADRWLTVAASTSPPLAAEVSSTRGLVRFGQGRFDEAADGFRAAARALPEWSDVGLFLALAERAAGRADAAHAAAARLEGGAQAGVLAHLALDAGDLAAAEALLAPAPAHPEVDLAWARLFAARGREDDARARLAAARAAGERLWPPGRLASERGLAGVSAPMAPGR